MGPNLISVLDVSQLCTFWILLVSLLVPHQDQLIQKIKYANQLRMILTFHVLQGLIINIKVLQTLTAVKLAIQVHISQLILNLGKYCSRYGAFSFTGDCALGYYCTSNSSFSRPDSVLASIPIVSYFKSTYGNYCSKGYYCPLNTASPIECDPGYYCPDYLMSSIDYATQKCSAGFYCSSKASVPNPTDGVTGNICPAGYYCSEGTVNPIPCPTGSYLGYTGATSRYNCSLCTPGYYCDSIGMINPTGYCQAGYYCPEGQSSPTPVQYYCPVGYQCPSGSIAPQKCATGYFSSSQMSSSCDICPVGKYCGDRNFAQDCDPGNYCPGLDLKINCPLGSYSPNIGLSTESQCLACPKGKSCHLTGLTSSASSCAAGFYCNGSAISPKPNNQIDLQGGNMCKPGSTCSLGSQLENLTPGGKYQKDYAGFVATDPCEAGYYCPIGSKVKNPLICQPGSYCEAGSSKMSSCPVGKYTVSRGASSITDCQDCPGGKYCNSEGLITVLNNCSAGYYCPFGMTVADPVQYLCPAGFQCPEGSIYPKTCEAGYYQPTTGNGNCSDCPEGYYCEGYESATTTKQCERGFYCPKNTKYSNQYPCPSGTYNSNSGAKSLLECLKCPIGYYCDRLGQYEYTDLVLAGYYSNVEGNQSPNRTICPKHTYCPIGSAMPLYCPKGTKTTSYGQTQASDCVPCSRGLYCNFYDYYTQLDNILTASAQNAESNSSYYGQCLDGYICLEGSAVNNPTNGISGYQCPVGYFCKSGDYDKTPCPPGQYNNLVGQTNCTACSSGSYCQELASTTMITCTAGYYCPSGTIQPIPCSPGTYNNKTGSSNINSCLSCPQTQYCDGFGLQLPTGYCSAGYICSSGSNTSTPYDSVFVTGKTINGICPKGYYCPQGATLPIACSVGYYNGDLGATQCLLCPPGKYCDDSGLIEPTGDCYEGYLCGWGSTYPYPQGSKCNSSETSGYCPEGAVAFYECQDGYLMNSVTGACELCPVGFVCKQNFLKTFCPLQKYCDDPENYPYGRLCPNGTNSSMTGLKKASECLPCPTGLFCLAGFSIGNCSAGYICNFGGDSPTPIANLGAYPCPKGFYCPKGALIPQLCPIGTYTFQVGAISIDECDYCKAGYYCEYGSIAPVECPQGNYCPLGSQEPTNCSVTRYNPKTLGQSYADCLACKGGYYCKDTALGNLFQFNTTYRCPFGNYCPMNTWRPFPCKAGTYSDDTLRLPPASLSECLSCPQHYYCPTETGFRFTNPCPSGTYCPQSSAQPILCPPGQYCNATLLRNQTVIVISICPEGYYCPLGSGAPLLCNKTRGEICKSGSSFPSITKTTATICGPGYYFGYGACNLCEPGYVCQLNTNTKFPVNLTKDGGLECPPGYYCPLGTSIPKQCPKGTYRPTTRGKSLSDCYQCPSGSYNSKLAQISCIKCGRGSNNTSDSQQCECIGAFRLWRLSDNQCVCQSPYTEPEISNDESQTSTDTQDCITPVLKVCGTGQHFDQTNSTCVSDDVCKLQSLCNNQGTSQGYYSQTQQTCLCNNVNSDSNSYCDDACIAKGLKAYLNNNGSICLTDGTNKKCYNQSAFGDSLFLSGVTCNQSECLIAGIQNSDGTMGGSYEALDIFVAKWKLSYPKYVSPYQSPAFSASKRFRNLQANGSSYIESSIICMQPNIPVSFSVSSKHFPVYISNSMYNTNPSFDYGLFDLLKTKLLNAGMSITTFFFSFQVTGVYIFGDYMDQQNSMTIVKVDSSCPTTKNIYPLTEQNLKLLNIYPQELKLQTMSQNLVFIPVCFIILTVISTLIQRIVESKIERKEIERRMRRVGRRRDFHNEDDKLDKKHYLADLYKLIKDNLDEVKKLIDNHNSRESLYKLLKDKTSLTKELGDNGKQVVDDLKEQLSKLLGELRFPDGRTLKDVLNERLLQRRLHNEDENDNQADHDELMDESDYNRTQSDSYDDEEDENDEIINATGQQLNESDDENDNLKKKNKNVSDHELERQIKLKQEQDKRKNLFKDRIGDIVENEEDRDKIVGSFDEKMRQLDNLLKNESKKQDDSLESKLAQRKLKRKQLQEQLDNRVRGKEQMLDDLKNEQDQMIEDFDDILDKGMKNTKLIEIQEKEKQDALSNLDRQKDQQLQAVRDEYMNRIKSAKSDKEKENILDEMQRRLSSIESSLDKEKAEQEKNLEKILKQRQARRVKKMAKEQDNRIESKSQEIQTLTKDIEKEKAQIYAEMGGIDASEVLDEKLREKVAQIMKKIDKNQQTLELDSIDKDQLDIFKVQQNLEKEKALKNIERELEEQSDDDRNKGEEVLKQKLQKERDEFNHKISKAKNEKERKSLIKESKKREKKIQEEIQNEKLKQERMLDEKKMNRQGRRKIKELEIESKQMGQMAEKEMELLNKKYRQQDKDQQNLYDQEVNQAVSKIEQKKDSGKEQAVILANETSDEMIRKRLRLLINKQFFELEKYLGTMYTQTAMEKIIAKERIKDKFRNLEEESYQTLQGEKLMTRLNTLKEDEQLELSMIDSKIDQEEKEKEAELREKLEDQFFKEKQAIIQQDSEKKQNLIQGILNRNRDDELVKDIGSKLLQANQQNTKEDIDRLEKDRQDNLDKIKLQIVAENEAEVQEMQQKIEEQMNREKEIVDQRMKQKRDEIIGDKKKKLEQKINEMKGTLSDFQREMIMKQYQNELDALEKAIAEERDNQLTKMRQKLIKRKIERERLKKEEEQKLKMESVKTDMRSFLKNKILENRAAEKKSNFGQQKQIDSVNLKDKLRMMLSQWNENVNQAKENLNDPQNIWEKNSQADSLRSSASKMSMVSKMSKITATSKFTNNFAANNQTAAAQQNFTMEELIRRIRRVERLTERMSEGNIPVHVVEEAKNTVSSIINRKKIL